jgi:hypothetical protein
MSSSYRIRTELGIDKVVQVKLEQNFDTLELLSLYINPNDVYTRACADYGVVVGRVFCNNGFGIPNAKVSIFIALDNADFDDTVISTLYPYKTYNDVNEDGYKYNLLPYTPSYTGHIPVGTFPGRDDVLKDKTVIQVYDKYYKFVVSTNGSGDFMILGVPPGQHTLFMQVDLSDIGEFSFTPADLIRIGRGTESQFNGAQFKFSENYSELPQIVTISKTIQVAPFYGEQETCNYSISRNDFDLTAEAQITISPTAVFMGSLVSTSDETKLGYNNVYNKCKIPKTMGDLCDLTAGPGQILAIRQSYKTDSSGLPILEKVELENGGKVIDENGTWLLEVPMNLEYVYTDEQGNRQISNNPEIGIPTKGKYRFKIKWEQGPALSESTKRAYFLVPNVREYGWGDSGDPYLGYNFNEQIGTTIPVSIPSNSPDDNGNYVLLSTYLVQNPNFLYRLNNTLNVENFQIFYLDGSPYTSQNIYSQDIPSLYFVYDRIDEGSNAIINFLKIDKDRFLLEQSYAFSLDWTDYVNVTDAINCEDTFMELQYNKVYTVSQLMDRYVSEKRPWNTTGIKNILDDKCTGEYNKFPTNDAFFRVSFTYIFYNIVFEVFRYVAILLTIVAHILGYFWVVLLPIVLLVITFIQLIIIGFCNFRNWVRSIFNRPDLPCPELLDLTQFADSNPFKNLGLPLLLYTEDGCERCNCKLGDSIGENLGMAQLTTVTQSSVLINSTDFELYRNVEDDQQYLAGLYAGNLADSVSGYPQNRCPIVSVGDITVKSNDDDSYTFPNWHFSSQIPYSEYLNSWWSKGRYFEPLIDEGGASNTITKPRYFYGSTRMRVTLEPDFNNPSTVYHMDNFQILVLDKQTEIPAAGTILSFQDKNLSTDLNYYNTENDNIFTSGKTNNLTNVTYKWTNPNNAQPLYTTYNLTGFTEFKKTSGFPADIEYFQVITGLTIGEYKSFVTNQTFGTIEPQFDYEGTAAQLGIDLNTITIEQLYLLAQLQEEYENTFGGYEYSTLNQVYRHKMQQYEFSTDTNMNCYDGRFRKSDYGYSTIEEVVPNMDNYMILILMRGVDVHSPRVKQRIDITSALRPPYSSLLKPNSDGSLPNIPYESTTMYVEGYYKMNIPLQPDNGTKVCTRHNQMANNNSTDQWGGRIFFNSYAFSYLPQLNQNVWSLGRYKQFNTTLPYYYSSLDILTFGPSSNNVPPGFVNSGYTANALDTSIGWLRKSYNNRMGFILLTENNGCGGPGGNCPVNTVITLNGGIPGEQATYSILTANGNPGNTDLDYSNIEYDAYRTNQYLEGGAFYQWTYNASNAGESCEIEGSMGLRYGSYANALGRMRFFSPTYRTTGSYQNGGYNGQTYDQIVMSDNSKIVMRSDRLPSSTSESLYGSNSFMVHQNPVFAFYTLTDSGDPVELTNFNQQNFSINDSTSQFVPYAEVSDSLSECEKAVMLECYELIDGVPTIKPDCVQIMNPTGREVYFNYGTGCYNLVSRLFVTLLPDIKSIIEWTQRNKINNAVCQNVFSHSFSNQWINGTLYAYPFNNKRVFAIGTQKPYSIFCKDTIYFHETSNNFYYRSSPWSTTEGFIGKNNTNFTVEINSQEYGTSFGNNKFLQSPTTILDLGPKASFIQELVNNDDYDGYIVSKIKSTSYNNVSEILNLFILSRLVNPNFLQFLIPSTPGVNEGSDDPTIRGFFKNRRWENDNTGTVPAMVDADYAQMISINSEFGISPFSVSNYAQTIDSVYQPVILGDENNFPFFGLLLTGNTQDRDYITPRRTIWNLQATIDTPQQYNFTEIPVNTQSVPFYLWKLIKMNNSDTDQPMDYGTIFGSQNNNWVTNYPDSTGEFSNAFFTHKYQKLDRINVASRYFQVDGNLAANYRSTLINFDSDNVPTENIPTQNFNPQFLVGAPNHFYFGLKRGSSALNRFLIKYVNTDEVIE